MFQQLLESNVVRRPRWGGSLLSTVAHAALISGAVALTATAGERPPEAPDVRVRFTPITPTTPAPPPRVTSTSSPASNRVVATAPVLQVSTEIPIGLPDIDLTRASSLVTDFSTARGGTFGGAPDGMIGGTGRADASGAWSEEQVDQPVVMAPGSASPNYPDALRTAGVAGAVLIEFVVDTLGRVEGGSGRVISEDHPLFGAAARAVLPRLRFVPAKAQGHKVRQLVRLPFRFDLNS